MRRTFTLIALALASAMPLAGCTAPASPDRAAALRQYPSYVDTFHDTRTDRQNAALRVGGFWN